MKRCLGGGGGPPCAIFGLLERFSVQVHRMTRAPHCVPSIGRPGRAVKKSEEHGRHPRRHSLPNASCRRTLTQSLELLCLSPKENEAQRPRKTEPRKQGKGQPPCSHPWPPFVLALPLLLHGRRGPQITNPLSTASFSRLSGRRDGGQGMGVPYSAVVLTHPRNPREN
ncbi:hypothetical protein V8C37DRAFT_297059 [Trichoderma ceciliae]